MGKSESRTKNKEKDWGGKEEECHSFALTTYPSPEAVHVAIFLAHISLCCFHNLNAVQQIYVHCKKVKRYLVNDAGKTNLNLRMSCFT